MIIIVITSKDFIEDLNKTLHVRYSEEHPKVLPFAEISKTHSLFIFKEYKWIQSLACGLHSVNINIVIIFTSHQTSTMCSEYDRQNPLHIFSIVALMSHLPLLIFIISFENYLKNPFLVCTVQSICFPTEI